jgi:N-acetylmuramoyl-L-alanine amidase
MLAVSIAVPKPDQRLPYVERCYVIGAVEPGVSNVVVQGKSFPVYRTGAWAAYIEVKEGENVIVASCEESGVPVEETRRFFVAPKPKPRTDASPAKPAERVYEKLDFAKDEPNPHPSGKSPREVTVVLDPGHGGKKDLGAVSPHGWCEKDANLLLSEAVREELVKLGYRVVPTRRNDRAVELYERPKAIYAVGADAFISIHHNAPAADRDAAAIRYAAVYSWNPIGESLAKSIARRMDEVQGGEMKSNGAMHANFAVTRNPEVPSCLIEADFITNPAGEEAAWDPVRRQRLAEAIAAGFADWHKGEESRILRLGDGL